MYIGIIHVYRYVFVCVFLLPFLSIRIFELYMFT